MKKVCLFIWLGMIAVLMGSCVRETVYEDPNGGKLDTRSGFTLSYSVAEPKINTYGDIPIEEGEDLINSLHVFFFDKTSGGTGNYIGYYEVPTTDGEGGAATPLSSTAEIPIRFSDITISTTPGTPGSTPVNKDYNMLLIANIEEFIDDDLEIWLQDLANVGAENDFLNTVKLIVEGVEEQGDNTKSVQQNNLPMNARASRSIDQEIVSAELKRSVARFDVYLENEAQTTHTVVSASIWNAYTQTSAWDNVFNTFDKARTKRYYGVSATDPLKIVGGLYSFENYVESYSANDEKTTCLIIGLKNNSTGVVGYYRANVNINEQGAQSLKRNSVYKIIVDKVSVDGATKEIDAYTNSKFLLGIRVNEWEIDNNNNILSDGDNVLVIPTSRIVFTPNAESRTFNIYAMGTGELDLTKVHLPVGITATLNAETKVLTVSATSTNVEREGFIEVSFGKLKATIEVVQTWETENFLDLSRYTLPQFPGNGVYQMEGNIQVKSSDLWNAKIYGEGFTFQYIGGSRNITEITGREPGQTFTITSEDNPNFEPRDAFVNVYLANDPSVNRILVLSQAARSSLEVDPDTFNKSISFNAVGDVTATSALPNVFTVASTGNWWVDIPMHSSHFTVTYLDMNGDPLTPQPSEGQVSGDGKFRINADVNTKSQTLDAVAQVYLTTTPSDRTTINISQGIFSVEYAPATFDKIPIGGGDAKFTITTSPVWPGANFTATVSTVGALNHQAYFGVAGQYSASGNIPSNELILTFPELVTFRGTEPVATVSIEVSVTGSDIFTKTLSITQEGIELKPMIWMTSIDSYGKMNAPTTSGTGAYANVLAWAVRDFKANAIGKVATEGFPNGSTYWTLGPLSNLSEANKAKVSVYYNNHYVTTNDNYGAVGRWLRGDDKRIAMTADWDGGRTNLIINGMGLSGYSASTGAGNGNSWSGGTGGRYDVQLPPSGVYKSADYRATRLWKYIFGKDAAPDEQGPFGEVDLDRFYMRLGVDFAYLTSWPDTFIPLLMYNYSASSSTDPYTRGCIFGIDPTTRFIFLGDHEIFGTVWEYSQWPWVDQPNNTYTKNGVTFPADNANNRVFLNNFIAWIVQTAQYGDSFNNEFKESVPHKMTAKD